MCWGGGGRRVRQQEVAYYLVQQDEKLKFHWGSGFSDFTSFSTCLGCHQNVRRI